MEARVSTYTGTSARFEELLEGMDRIAVARELEQLAGFQGVDVLVDHSARKVLTITYWDSAESAQASAGPANAIRAQLAHESGQIIQSVETYEVWLRLGKA
ncbi:hypothetical protein [Saccharopolyspora taberi]|uniref:ABM domain-containing protein n=1 Tax=Saccharopolyspora taberi TaxID=60895 RepID=A0ABN3VJJ9_9PSEU